MFPGQQPRGGHVARPGSQGRVHIHPPPGPWRQMSPGPGTRAGPSHLRLLGALTLWGQEGSQKASRKGCSLLPWAVAVGTQGGDGGAHRRELEWHIPWLHYPLPVSCGCHPLTSPRKNPTGRGSPLNSSYRVASWSMEKGSNWVQRSKWKLSNTLFNSMIMCLKYHQFGHNGSYKPSPSGDTPRIFSRPA